MPLLIDGFNLIYKFPDLEEMMYRGLLDNARAGLLDKLKEFQSIKKADIRVVFDGKKAPANNKRSENIGTIDIFYSLDYSADFLIKQFIKKDINPKMTTVITSDKDIIFYVKRFKAKIMESEKFAAYLDKSVKDHYLSLEPEKEEDPVISTDEISYWEKLFKSKKK